MTDDEIWDAVADELRAAGVEFGKAQILANRLLPVVRRAQAAALRDAADSGAMPYAGRALLNRRADALDSQ